MSLEKTRNYSLEEFVGALLLWASQGHHAMAAVWSYEVS